MVGERYEIGDEAVRRTEKFGNEEVVWLCMLCGQKHFEGFCKVVEHIRTAHTVPTILLDIEKWLAYVAVEDIE